MLQQRFHFALKFNIVPASLIELTVAILGRNVPQSLEKSRRFFKLSSVHYYRRYVSD